MQWSGRLPIWALERAVVLADCCMLRRPASRILMVMHVSSAFTSGRNVPADNLVLQTTERAQTTRHAILLLPVCGHAPRG
jgi:hypothetical protein